MAEIIEETLCELVQNYRHIYDVTTPGTGTDNPNRTAGRTAVQTGNECQLVSGKGEVEVCATLVYSLGGALYWMYCTTSIPT